MHRTITSLTSLSVLALATLSGTAMAQYREEPRRDSVRLAERSGHMKITLSEAIELAKNHTQGVVIGARLTSSQITHDSDRQRQQQDQDYSRRDQTPANNRDERDEKDQMHGRRQDSASDSPGMSRSQNSSPKAFAIVTCVINRARVRDVLVDMSNGTVLGMQSMYASGETRQGNYPRGTSADQSQFALVRASELMNATVRNAENQRVGDIDELVINPDSNRIIYGVLRRGGILGINESRYAVSTNELTVPKDGNIMLYLNNDDFEGHSGFDNNAWPTQADSQWNTRWTQDAESYKPATKILKATELIGTDVQTSDGQSMGQINDLIVEPRSGRVVYAIVDCERCDIAVPMELVEVKGSGRVMKMTNTEVMALPILNPDNDPDWSDARWNRRIHDNYKVKLDLSPVQNEGSQR